MKRKKHILLLCLLMAAFLFAASCGAPAPEEAPPAEITRVISMGPAHTEVLVALGFGDKLIAVDDFSAPIPGVPEGLPLLDMMAPDGERILALMPDVLFATGMTQVDGIDPFGIVSDAGISVVHIPFSTSIADIKADIRLIAEVMGASESGEALVAEMTQAINEIRAVGEGIGDRKTVYFEISEPPFMYSFGQGVFLHEMLTLIGAENAFAHQDAWFLVADEAVFEANPDVILTNVFGDGEAAVREILGRPGWEAIAAVEAGRVYHIDTDSSSRASHNIIRALNEMARAVYPAYF